MLDEAERNLINLLRSESREQGNNNVKFSISDHIIGASGKDYGKGVYLDSTLLEGLTEKEQKQMVKERIKELGGNDFTAYDKNNNPVQIKIAPKGQKFTNRKGKRVDVSHDLATKNNDNENKRIIVVHSDELIETANFDSVNPSKYTHGWLDNYQNNPWDTWKVFVQQKNNSVWEAQLRVANSRNGEKYLYDVVEIKMVEGGVKSPPTTTINNIPQTTNNNNGKKQSGDSGMFSLKIQNVGEHKRKQLDIVQATNPMHDDYHTGIRTVEDIYTADEVFTEDEFAGTPDWTYEDAQTALEKGKVTVYSSYAINDGIFVTPSRMMAKDYAGSGRVYSKEVPLESAAWISSEEGQYAPVNEDIRFSIPVYQYDGETAKSRGIRSQAVNEFADSLGGMFGITGKIGREGLRKSAYQIADRVEKFGFITKADMDNFFDAAYQAARFTDEKADYAPLKKRIREAGIEPLGGREYLDFVQKYRGKIKFKRGGLPIDTLYQELNENYPEYFPDSIINPYDQMEKLGEV